MACPFLLRNDPHRKDFEMPIYKRCDRCHKRLPAGTTCDCMKQARRESRSGKEARKEYGTQRWKIKRDQIMEQYCRLDVLLFYRDRQVVPADMVHHIEPLKERPDLWLDDGNLIPLSNATHAEVEHNYDLNPESKRRQQQELRDAQSFLRAFLRSGEEDLE